MTIQLTQKETMILEDQKKHEELCVQKYKSYAKQVHDPELKQMFNSHAGRSSSIWIQLTRC